MSENTNKALPFFARFLEEQQSEPEDETPQPFPFTYKFPSDWEDR
ncbi:MAG: hypothetical protein C6Y22_09425 [Hapalosiphonaceae cyanobacterium JJU2]|nr:MAG: hypothetical protein C6Y22_09425 [Hapalosiphonaceae cyanobacterium JJU2]TBR56831.1 hypothetical protein B4U84_27835 [Westiellopsis prolifica IICB1]